jgi:hypothetical protein
VSDDPTAVLRAHVRRFNEAVRSGDYSEMIRGFTPDAEMVFEGVAVGPFVGREAIAAAYRAQPPDGEVNLLGAPRIRGESVESDYAWVDDGGRAGRMTVTVRGDLIARLTVTFE